VEPVKKYEKAVKHHWIYFFILAYVISWILWAPIVIFDNVHPGVFTISLVLGGFGPMAAGYMVSRKEYGKMGTRDYFYRIFDYRRNVKTYLMTLLIPIGIFLLAYLFYRILGGETFDFSEVPNPLIYPLLLLVVIFTGGGLEESGWRGYALPRLMERFTPVFASLLIGVFWICWHIPLFFSEGVTQGNFDFLWYLINGLGLSILFTIFHLYSKGSAFIAIILHGGVNAPSAWFPMKSTIDTPIGDVAAHFPISLATWLVVLILIFRLKPQLMKKRRFQLRCKHSG